jgi:hypothetical protein
VGIQNKADMKTKALLITFTVYVALCRLFSPSIKVAFAQNYVKVYADCRWAPVLQEAHGGRPGRHPGRVPGRAFLPAAAP